MLIQLYLAMGISIVIAALCSLCEAILYSVPSGHVEVLAKAGKRSGPILRKLKKDIDRPITAILTMNTIACTMGVALAGASAADVFGDQYLGWFSGSFTMAILLFSEILPKTAGVAFAKKLAPWVAVPLAWLVLVMAPLIWLCQLVTRLIPRQSKESLVSAEEIQAIAMLSRQSGAIAPEQEKVIANILGLQNIMVRQVMTPRTVTFSLSEYLTVAEARKLAAWEQHSRVPVYDKDADDVVGIILRKDIFRSDPEEKKDEPLSAFMHPVHFVPETAPLNRVLLDFLERRQHLFVVVDEYGSVTGVISLEDILEEIMGREIIDESDKAGDLRELARRKKRFLIGE